MPEGRQSGSFVLRTSGVRSQDVFESDWRDPLRCPRGPRVPVGDPRSKPWSDLNERKNKNGSEPRGSLPAISGESVKGGTPLSQERNDKSELAEARGSARGSFDLRREAPGASGVGLRSALPGVTPFLRTGAPPLERSTGQRRREAPGGSEGGLTPERTNGAALEKPCAPLPDRSTVSGSRSGGRRPRGSTRTLWDSPLRLPRAAARRLPRPGTRCGGSRTPAKPARPGKAP